MGPQSKYNVEKMLEKAHATIELTFELYLANKKLLSGVDEDMEVAVSNILNTDITDIGLISLAKSLTGRRRHQFIDMIVQSDSTDSADSNDNDIQVKKRKKLRENCKPWSELFEDIKRKKVKDIDKEIIEYEISNLYLDTINDGSSVLIKNIKLELEW